MARFDLSQYATVEERLRSFWASDEARDARIVTVNHTQDSSLWVIETRLYLTAGDQAADLPKTTGWASEANSDPFALERCETSSIGRCLANYIYSGSKRPSREEMEKVEKFNAVEALSSMGERDWKADADSLNDKEALRSLWAQAKAKRATTSVLDYIKERANALPDTSSVSSGTEGGIPGLFDETATGQEGGSASAKPKAGRGK